MSNLIYKTEVAVGAFDVLLGASMLMRMETYVDEDGALVDLSAEDLVLRVGIAGQPAILQLTIPEEAGEGYVVWKLTGAQLQTVADALPVYGGVQAQVDLLASVSGELFAMWTGALWMRSGVLAPA